MQASKIVIIQCEGLVCFGLNIYFPVLYVQNLARISLGHGICSRQG